MANSACFTDQVREASPLKPNAGADIGINLYDVVTKLLFKTPHEFPDGARACSQSLSDTESDSNFRNSTPMDLHENTSERGSLSSHVANMAGLPDYHEKISRDPCMVSPLDASASDLSNVSSDRAASHHIIPFASLGATFDPRLRNPNTWEPLPSVSASIPRAESNSQDPFRKDEIDRSDHSASQNQRDNG